MRCKWRTACGNCSFPLSKIFGKECAWPECPNAEMKEKFEKKEIVYTEEIANKVWKKRW